MELAEVLGNRSLNNYGSSPMSPNVQLSSGHAGTINSSADETWKETWRQKQELRMTEKLSKQNIQSDLPFPANYFVSAHNSWLQFLEARQIPDNMLARIVQGDAFASLFLFIIFLNAAWLGYEAHSSMADVNMRYGSLHAFVKIAFSIVFSFEIVLKIAGMRWQFIAGPEWKWNLFDTFLVGLSVPSLLGTNVNMTFARILKLVRMVRVLRLFRVVQAFLELRHMVVAVWGSLGTMFWCAVLFMFGMYCFAVMIMQTASTWIETSTPEDAVVVTHLQKKYGSMQQSMLTLFHTVSGGDWLVASSPLNEIFSGYDYIFATYIFLMSIGFLNVVIGLFCEKAANAVDSDRDLRTLREREDAEGFITEMGEIFKEMDEDGVGEIKWEHFEAYISSEGTGHFLRSHGIATHDAWELFTLLDQMDQCPSGSIDMVSFVMGMQRLSGSSTGSDVVLTLIEARKRGHAMETQMNVIRSEVALGFEELRNLLPKRPSRTSRWDI